MRVLVFPSLMLSLMLAPLASAAQDRSQALRERQRAWPEQRVGQGMPDAVRRVEQNQQEMMSSVTAGMNLPAGMKLPF